MPKILDFADKANQRFKIRNVSATKAEIILYAGIGADYWNDGTMISAKQVSDEIKEIPATVTEIVVRINSPGGDVFDGIAIYNRLKQHKAKKTVYIDGLAASIASIIALCGDEIIIGEGALFMVHLPWTMAWGNRMDLDNVINDLLNVEEQMLGIYAKKTGLTKMEVKKLLEAETWMGADEAIEMGFVDKKAEESVPIAASVIDRATWINRKPKAFKSMDEAITSAKDELKRKIQDRIARK